MRKADWTLAGRRFLSIDSPGPHPFSFTPAISVFITCDDEAGIERLFAGLSAGGEVMMPLDDDGFSRRFGWVADTYGVTWQLNLP